MNRLKILVIAPLRWIDQRPCHLISETVTGLRGLANLRQLFLAGQSFRRSINRAPSFGNGTRKALAQRICSFSKYSSGRYRPSG